MRHHNKNRKFGRDKDQRRALLQSLARNLVIKSRIKTTLAKAKELRKFIEPMITKAKIDTVASRRLVASRLLGTPGDTVKLFKHASNYVDRSGGYTRIVKLAPRKSDSAEMAYIEFV